MNRHLTSEYFDGVVGGIAVGLSIAMVLYVLAHVVWSLVR